MTVEERLAKLEDLFYRQNMIDKTVFRRPVTFNSDISTDNTAGIKIGKTTDKLGIFGVTPVVQQAAITTPTGGVTVDSQARTAIGDIITKLKNLGLTL